MALGFVLFMKALIGLLIGFFHHKRGHTLPGILLALSLWILIPGVDEAVTVPLLVMAGIPIIPILVIYYSIGIILFLSYLLALRKLSIKWFFLLCAVGIIIVFLLNHFKILGGFVGL